ncbi:MAG TPA: hypothetical protein VHZ33_29445 [Trebonia sp.]|jgi:hypothetical protein|nr:hypothetical protein [Trebonia sp.]
MRRHLIGIGLAVVLSAAVFFGAGWAFNRLFMRNLGSEWLPPPAGANFTSNSVVTGGLAAMAGVALLIGLAIVIRWVSPLATGLPGLVLLAWTAMYVTGPTRAVDYIPLRAHGFGLGFLGLGTTGILGAAGVVLVMPLFFPSRWRRSVNANVNTNVNTEAEDDLIEATSVTTPGRTGLVAGMGSSAWESLTSENTKLNDPDW